MSAQFVLVVYDISNDRRRTKLHNKLLDFGTPVQYSVFECLLDEEGLERMKKAVMRVIRPRVDRVRFYYLCARCLPRTEVTCGKEVLSDQPDTLVV
jgi:CRISPR-associated protein Cas2